MATRDQVYVDIITETKKSVGSLLKYAAALGGAYMAIKKVVAIAKDMVKFWGIQEQAEAKLTSAIRSTGKEATISAQSLFDYASGLQDVTTYGDEATISAMALLQQLGDLSEKGLKQLTPLIQDFASTGMVNLETAASLVGKTLGSTTNALTRYGIVIDMSGTKQEKLAAITKALQDKFGGLSQDLATTGSGALEQYRNAVGDLREAQGKAITEGIEPFVRGLTKIIKEMAAAKLEAIATKRAYEDLKNLGEDQVLAENQQLLILKDQVKILGQVAASYEMLDEAANAAYNAALNRLQAYKDALTAEEYWNSLAADASDKRAATELANATALREWIEKINEKYAQTAESKKEILDAEIAWYEYWLPRSKVHKESVEAILKMLYEQRDATKEVTDEVKLLNVELQDWIASQLEIVSGFPALTRAQLGLNSAMNAFIDELSAANTFFLETIEITKDAVIAMDDYGRVIKMAAINLDNFAGMEERAKGLIEDTTYAIEDQVDAIKKLTEEQQIMASIATKAFTAFGKAFADAAVEGADVFKEAIKAGVASAVEAIAMAAMAAAGASIGLLQFGKAAALALAGTAAFATAAGIRALGTGGLVTGPTLALLGERGPERVTKIGKEGAMGGITLNVYGSLITEDNLLRAIESRVMGRLTRVY